ncbi:hypothetical protein M011DRAFT_461202 [Sporormia fimetaria CBS 119925]|uniref:Knr4/Smi1-like domain-containing protein n=1 Tax=Sporormia fimetaria CBS 119925 TaxID=1340428 RepID=A0A6A6V2I2_9PLEO|nr:hypothetical protein M011DRAFT_461202 [Sporormia fimetaria CBS 119925]
MSHRTWRKFSREHILKEKNPWEVARNAFEIALELALLGSVAEATKLFTVSESFSKECKSIWSPGLYFAWEATGLWPDSIPAEARQPEAMRQLEVERILWRRETHATESGLKELIAATLGDGRRQPRDDELLAALDLSAFMNRREEATQVLQPLADNFDRNWTKISKSRQAWKYFKDGVVASAIGVNSKKLVAFQQEVLQTFTDRLSNGPLRKYRDVPMPDLLNLCNDNTLKNAVWEEMDVDPDEPPSTILRKGATSDEIAALEQRLEHDLPDDYKEFLAVSNGMDSCWNGYTREPELLGTDGVHNFDATEQQKMMEEAAVDLGFYMSESLRMKWPRLTTVIKVNTGDEESTFVWFCLPEMIRQAAVEFFALIPSLPESERDHVTRMMGYYHAGTREADSVGWIVGVWAPQTFDFVVYNSWREYIEMLAEESAHEDTFDEVDTQGRPLHSVEIFAYQLR